MSKYTRFGWLPAITIVVGSIISVCGGSTGAAVGWLLTITIVAGFIISACGGSTEAATIMGVTRRRSHEKLPVLHVKP